MTRAQLARGERGRELLKQMQYQPMPVEEQIAVLFACVNGFIDDVPVKRIAAFEKEFLDYMHHSAPGILKKIVQEKVISDEIHKGLTEAIKEFKKTFMAGEVKEEEPETAESKA
jgi:F-type H+-transporting ATPase subunit alpha